MLLPDFRAQSRYCLLTLIPGPVVGIQRPKGVWSDSEGPGRSYAAAAAAAAAAATAQ